MNMTFCIEYDKETIDAAELLSLKIVDLAEQLSAPPKVIALALAVCMRSLGKVAPSFIDDKNVQ